MKDSVLRLSRNFVQGVLPEVVYDKLLSTMVKETEIRSEPSIREKQETIDVQPGVKFVVFWKSLNIGTGYALSVFVHGHEVARFDCFGAGKGHYHLALAANTKAELDRLFFDVQTVPEQVDRTLFELKKNLQYYLQRNPKRAVRAVTLDQAKLDAACAQAREKML